MTFIRLMLTMAIAAGLAASGTVYAQSSTATADTTKTSTENETDSDGLADLSDEEVAKAAVALLDKQMKRLASDRVPLILRHETRCISIFPKISKVGLIVAGKSGRGLTSCRQPISGLWSAPAYYNLSAASLGLQAGVQTSTLMMLIIDDAGVEKLLSEKMSLGSEASIAAGPVGLESGVQPNASILAYSRAEGVFAGLDIGGTVIGFDAEANARAYGAAGKTAKELLFGETIPTGSLKSLQNTLNLFAPYKG